MATSNQERDLCPRLSQQADMGMCKWAVKCTHCAYAVPRPEVPTFSQHCLHVLSFSPPAIGWFPLRAQLCPPWMHVNCN